jgi:hypothetical protein
MARNPIGTPRVTVFQVVNRTALVDGATARLLM